MKSIIVTAYSFYELSPQAQAKAMRQLKVIETTRAMLGNARSAVIHLVLSTGTPAVNVRPDGNNVTIGGRVNGWDNTNVRTARDAMKNCGIPARYVYEYYDLLLQLNDIRKQARGRFYIELDAPVTERIRLTEELATVPKHEVGMLKADLVTWAAKFIGLLNEMYANMSDENFVHKYKPLRDVVKARRLTIHVENTLYLEDGTPLKDIVYTANPDRRED